MVVDALQSKQRWLQGAVEKRLHEELDKFQVEVNEDKTNRSELSRGESFGFPGFEFKRLRSRSGRWMPLCRPQTKKRTALLRRLKVIFRRLRSQPITRVIEAINPVLRVWINYFAVGHASRCFSLVRNWVEPKIRRHLTKSHQRRGFGWKRWSRRWLYDALEYM